MSKMEGWQPTMNLRYVRRDTQTTVMRILQQQWVFATGWVTPMKYVSGPEQYEWRDVQEVEK